MFLERLLKLGGMLDQLSKIVNITRDVKEFYEKGNLDRSHIDLLVNGRAEAVLDKIEKQVKEIKTNLGVDLQCEVEDEILTSQSSTSPEVLD
jgi:uncharacterized protein (UPF0276 family)